MYLLAKYETENIHKIIQVKNKYHPEWLWKELQTRGAKTKDPGVVVLSLLSQVIIPRGGRHTLRGNFEGMAEEKWASNADKAEKKDIWIIWGT